MQAQGRSSSPRFKKRILLSIHPLKSRQRAALYLRPESARPQAAIANARPQKKNSVELPNNHCTPPYERGNQFPYGPIANRPLPHSIRPHPEKSRPRRSGQPLPEHDPSRGTRTLAGAVGRQHLSDRQPQGQQRQTGTQWLPPLARRQHRFFHLRPSRPPSHAGSRSPTERARRRIRD